MKQENNSTETVKKLPLDDRLQIILQYWGQKLRHEGVADSFKPWALQGTVIVSPTHRAYGLSKLSIEVKPLSKINEEDKKTIQKALGWKGSLKHIDMLLAHLMTPKEDWPANVQTVVDVLRERGIATRYKNWSVEELVEFGIFKLIE